MAIGLAMMGLAGAGIMVTAIPEVLYQVKKE